ncbi:MAG TPA: dTDP-4-dehydrorhamnose reductase [Verrucomicrobiae bacterium]|nr:dTDP-4-dehydrorhamnose reductase [Verrucomicrobiae bacterium]
MSRILVTGGTGLLAYALAKFRAADRQMIFLRHEDFDLVDSEQMLRQLDFIVPQAVINTAAYNLVDRCEQARELSWVVNAKGPEVLAEICAARNIPLVHYGTDYVFDGAKKAPYSETDEPNPLNHYGLGKLAGERAVLAASPRHLVLRTSWVFGWHPTQAKTFVHTVVNAARGGRTLKATTDQLSAPTFAGDLAQWTIELLCCGAAGLFHAVNDEGVSRFDWAKIILEEAVRAGLLSAAPPVEPVLSSLFNSTMRRPDYTVMSNEKLSRQLGRPLGSWRGGLRKMLAQMK